MGLSGFFVESDGNAHCYGRYEASALWIDALDPVSGVQQELSRCQLLSPSLRSHGTHHSAAAAPYSEAVSGWIIVWPSKYSRMQMIDVGFGHKLRIIYLFLV